MRIRPALGDHLLRINLSAWNRGTSIRCDGEKSPSLANLGPAAAFDVRLDRSGGHPQIPADNIIAVFIGSLP